MRQASRYTDDAPLLLVSVLPRCRPLPAAQRLPTTVIPDHYDLTFVVDLAHERFDGTETIHVQVDEPTSQVVLNAVEITFARSRSAPAPRRRTRRSRSNENDQTATLTVPKPLAEGPDRDPHRVSAAS